jgi:uncharacterized protein (TIGR03067 family)
MRLHVWLIVAALLALAADGPKEKKDKAAFQGAWKVTQLIENGESQPAEVIAKVRIFFKGDRFTTKEAADKPEQAHAYKISARKQPKIIDVTPAAGPHKDKVFQGIYSLDGAELRICVAYPGDDRPKKFEAKADSGYVLMILKRDKP